MKPSSNARQISSEHSFDLLRFVFFQELSETEWSAYKELVRKAKEAKVDALKNELNKKLGHPRHR